MIALHATSPMGGALRYWVKEGHSRRMGYYSMGNDPVCMHIHAKFLIFLNNNPTRRSLVLESCNKQKAHTPFNLPSRSPSPHLASVFRISY